MERIVRPGEFYRHFKGNLYQIVAVAYHSESGERMVVYQALYGDFRTYVRPYDMFVSEVDREKYPQAAQQYRFEQVTPEKAPKSADTQPDTAERQPHPALLRFLDTDDFGERMECLKQLARTGAQEDIDSLYVALDMRPQAGTIEEQADGIGRCLAAQHRYDGRHLR